jgi:hypothetical protein
MKNKLICRGRGIIVGVKKKFPILEYTNFITENKLKCTSGNSIALEILSRTIVYT